MADPDGALWWAWMIENETGYVPVAFSCSVINLKSRIARFKSDFVLPDFRGQGIYSLIFQARWEHAVTNKIKKATAFCTPMSLPTYLKYGFVIKSYKGDIAFVERELFK